ncbi:GntR family transcriptional regulator [Rhodococcus sp. NPDC127530]|uniref:GntR family transcriptional regulator n=1 Tax=Rhodococcus TaxID=1827 RepID=UPI0011416071|nr:GntR family transcriptional regulator [Rhodococcus sp. WS4]
MAASGTSVADSTGMLSRVPLRDQVVEVLRDMIVRGVLESGTRINEVELAARLGISRGPLREAIQRLSAEGLIDSQRNRGAFIREITVEDVRHMYELRQVLEVTAAKFAAARATDSDIAELDEQIEEADRLLAAKSATAYPVESDFHLTVLRLAKNPYLEQAGGELQVQLRLARLRAGGSPERAREALNEHRDILAAIAARDVRAAGKAMTLHLRNSLSRFTAMAADTGES